MVRNRHFISNMIRQEYTYTVSITIISPHNSPHVSYIGINPVSHIVPFTTNSNRIANRVPRTQRLGHPIRIHSLRNQQFFPVILFQIIFILKIIQIGSSFKFQLIGCIQIIIRR